MTYQPFLPEVLAGSVEPRHAAVSLRRHLHRTRLIAGTVTAIDHEHRNVTVQPADGPAFPLGYDIIVVTAGAVTRKLAVPGVAEQAIGLKHVEEAVAIRDRMLTAFDRAAALPPGPRRQRLLTVTFAGGGFSGVEGFGELLSLATSLIRRYPELSPAELRFHLVEARDRILPEVSDRPGRWVVRSLEKRGARVHLNRVRWLSLPEPNGIDVAIVAHEEIAAAVKAGDADRGDRVLTVHLRSVLDMLPAIRDRFPGYFEQDDEDLPALPDTSGLTIGWQACRG